MEITIKPIMPEILADFLYFFDQVAFTDNPDWAGCYCYFYHISCSGAQWAKRLKEENREGARQLILGGGMSGYLAYDHRSPIGWCNANRKASYERLVGEKDLGGEKGEKVGSMVCFIIASGYRKKGVARQLLDQAVAGFKESGYEYGEAYPRKRAATDAQHYHGPLAMYEKAGFKVYKEFPEYLIVRKKL